MEMAVKKEVFLENYLGLLNGLSRGIQDKAG